MCRFRPFAGTLDLFDPAPLASRRAGRELRTRSEPAAATQL